MSNHLDVFIASQSSAPSLSPLDSDGIINAIHMEQVIGTLVRMHPSGRYEGYLAQSWKNSEDFKEWTFNLKKGLICEDGTQINSRSFVTSLTKVIRLIRRHSELPLIDRLQGFQDVENKDISGLQVIDDHSFKFVFDKPVTTGLLEYLALPYLGFYCASDFNADGSWKDTKKVSSSAAYKVDAWSGQGPVTLKKRPEWFKSAANSPDSVTIHINTKDQIKPPKSRAFIISFLLESGDVPQDFKVVNLLPTIFHGVVLSPAKTPWLKSQKNRELVKSAIRRQQTKNPPPILSATPVDRFYPHMSKPLELVKSSGLLDGVGSFIEPLEILTVEKPSKSSQYMVETTIKALDELGIPYRMNIREQGQKDLMKYYRDQSKYDVRPVSVDTGGGIENQLVKFMFCSNLGVTFPDPSKRICQLVDEYEKKYGDVVPTDAMTEYIHRFDTILDEDSSVIPFMKTGHSWVLSPDIDVNSVSPTMGIPYFDLINLYE
jgi:hypothetical protein